MALFMKTMRDWPKLFKPLRQGKRELAARRRENARSLRPRKKHVCLMIGALLPGGAERQLCNLAVGLKRAGWNATVLLYDDRHEAPHYRRFLESEGIDCTMLEHSPVDDVPALLKDIPPIFAARSVALCKILRQLRPELLISYLDYQNVISGLGGALAGVPRILLSARSLNPMHFPHFGGTSFADSLRAMYRLALEQPGIRLSANSLASAQSYAAWLGMPKAKIKVVPNCVTEEFIKPVSPARIKAKRRKLGLEKDQLLILGLARFSPEKNPLDFVRVIAALRRKHPQLRAMLCGGGVLEGDVRALIRRLKLKNVILLPGNIGDAPLMMRAADILLHTAAVESAPNVILEAQAAGLPVVATDTSGARLCLADKAQGFLKKPGDIEGLTSACNTLLSKPKLRKRLAVEGRAFVLKRFSIAALTKETLVAAGAGKR